MTGSTSTTSATTQARWLRSSRDAQGADGKARAFDRPCSLIYQYATAERQREIADKMDAVLVPLRQKTAADVLDRG